MHPDRSQNERDDRNTKRLEDEVRLLFVAASRAGVEYGAPENATTSLTFIYSMTPLLHPPPQPFITLTIEAQKDGLAVIQHCNTQSFETVAPRRLKQDAVGI